MDQQHLLSSNSRRWQALNGVLFVTFFIAGDVLGGALAVVPLPLPGAPATEVARYYVESQTAALAVGVVQILSAISLFVFAVCVSGFVRRIWSEGSALPNLTLTGGVLAATFLLVSALLALALALVAAGGDLALVGVLRSLNFLSGGTLHVASLGMFIGAASIVARRVKALPSWICWLGIVQATLATLSLVSLVVFPAAVFILIGRLLGFVWSIAVGLALAFGRRRDRTAGSDRVVLS
jgi:hypothetical protein